jgi:hypothetical protein
VAFREPRAKIPQMAWVLSGAVAVALCVLVMSAAIHDGQKTFFVEGDAYLFRLIAQRPLGSTHGFAAVGRLSEAPYRYGRIGFPFLAWLLALGRPAWAGWSLVVISVASIASIPGIAAVLLDDLGAPPAAAGLVLLAPGLLLNYGHPYADPLLVALLLLACVLEGRGRRPAALVTLAAAILVKEIAVFALVPWLWAAWVRRDRRAAAAVAATVAPYLMWSVWIRLRLGSFPFLAHTYSRAGALSPPFVGLAQAVSARTPDIATVVICVAITAALGTLAAWLARGTRIGVLAGVYTVVTVCLGKNALTFLLENLRVLVVAQVFGVLCVAVAIAAWRREKEVAGRRGLFVGLPDL